MNLPRDKALIKIVAIVHDDADDYPIADIRQHFYTQMKKRGYKYVSRAVIKDQSFRIWRVE